jgi:hypothetical protein
MCQQCLEHSLVHAEQQANAYFLAKLTGTLLLVPVSFAKKIQLVPAQQVV